MSASSVPTVQLRHTLPDGSSHIDWLIAQDAAGERPLITFRLARPLHRPPTTDESPGVAAVESAAEEETGQGGERGQSRRWALDGERLPDHRPKYLAYEGPISNDRGHVVRIAAGRLHDLDRLLAGHAVPIHWNAFTDPGLGEPERPCSVLVCVFPLRPDCWRLEVTRHAPHHA